MHPRRPHVPSSIRPHPGATRPFSSSPSAPSPFLCTHTAAGTRTVATDSIRFPPPISFLLSPRPRSVPQLPLVTCPQTRLFPLHPPTSQRCAGCLSCLHDFVRAYGAQVLFAVGPFLILTTCLAHLSGTPKSVSPDQTYTRFLGPACSKRSSTQHLVRHLTHASCCQSLCISSS